MSTSSRNESGLNMLYEQVEKRLATETLHEIARLVATLEPIETSSDSNILALPPSTSTSQLAIEAPPQDEPSKEDYSPSAPKRSKRS